jgi:hypothetical protein
MTGTVTLEFLRREWGRAYEFTTGPDGTITATPLRAGLDTLTAADPPGMLARIRRSYRGVSGGNSST